MIGVNRRWRLNCAFVLSDKHSMALHRPFTGYALTLLILLSAADSAGHAQAPADFGLRLEFGCAAPDVLDTFKGTYERKMSRGKRIAKVNISPNLKDQLFNLVSEARFFEIPENLGALELCEPQTAYRLYVKSDGRVHVVRWTDCHDGHDNGTDEGRRIVHLVEGILTPFRDMASVRRLPDTDLTCM
jgi:hypothetical protein